MEHVRASVTITGKVQGVWFRAETQKAARERNVTGWVRNKRDGSVEALMEGLAADVQSMLDWCRHGPPLAAVDRVDAKWQAYAGEFDAFAVRYD